MSSGILLVDKPLGKTSFFLVSALRKITGIRKIGHTGTLDPLATGVMVMLIGREATRLAPQLMNHNKVYAATILLGQKTTTLDIEGEIVDESSYIPSLQEVEKAIESFQGTTEQIPPMYSAKKVSGKKLYELAREGKEIERKPVSVTMHIRLIDYTYPYIKVEVECSSGTYMRSLADDLGRHLTSFGTLCELRRTKSGPFTIEECVTLNSLDRTQMPLKKLGDLSVDHKEIDYV